MKFLTLTPAIAATILTFIASTNAQPIDSSLGLLEARGKGGRPASPKPDQPKGKREVEELVARGKGGSPAPVKPSGGGGGSSKPKREVEELVARGKGGGAAPSKPGHGGGGSSKPKRDTDSLVARGRGATPPYTPPPTPPPRSRPRELETEELVARGRGATPPYTPPPTPPPRSRPRELEEFAVRELLEELDARSFELEELEARGSGMSKSSKSSSDRKAKWDTGNPRPETPKGEVRPYFAGKKDDYFGDWQGVQKGVHNPAAGKGKYKRQFDDEYELFF